MAMKTKLSMKIIDRLEIMEKFVLLPPKPPVFSITILKTSNELCKSVGQSKPMSIVALTGTSNISNLALKY